MLLPDLTAEDLEQMRRAAIDYYPRVGHERAAAFVEELRRDAVMLSDGRPRIGFWNAEIHEGELVLVRTPPLSPLMYYWGLIFEEHDGEWIPQREYNWVDEMEIPDDLLPLIQRSAAR